MNPSSPAPQKTSRWIWLLLVLGIALTLLFGFRAVRSFAQIQLTGLQPGTTDVDAIRGWMTVPYIAKTYCVPQDYVYAQMGIPPAGNGKKSLGELNREYFSGQPGIALQKVKDAIRTYKPTCEPRSPGQ